MEANGLPSPCSHPNSAPQGTQDWKEQEACMHAKSIQLCLTLCDPMDCSPPGSSVHGIPRKEYSSGLLFPPPGGLSDPGIEPLSPETPALQVDS